MTVSVRSALVIATLSASVGCSNLDRFDTKEGEAYCGNISTAHFIIEDFDVTTQMRLTLDTDQLSSVPGTLTTSVVPENPKTCKGLPVLDNAPMRVTETLLHDQLSTFEFGNGREHNFMAWVDSSCAGPILAVVSLMKSDDIEVRLMKPPVPSPDAGAEPAPGGFGLFQLKRYKQACTF